MPRERCSICKRLSDVREHNCYVCEKRQCYQHSIIVREGCDQREVSVLRGFYCVGCMFLVKHPKKDLFCIIGETEYEIGPAFLECPSCPNKTQLSDTEGRPYCARCDRFFNHQLL